MKKLLLLSASALLSLSAMAQVSEPTLTKDWEKTTELPAAGQARGGASYGGKFYLNDKSVSTLYSYAAEDGTRATISGVNAAGTALNFDGAGNAILSTTFSGASSAQNFLLWNAKTGQTVDLSISDLLNTLGLTATRLDLIGRGAGDIFSSEGGAFFIANYKSGDKFKILKLYIVNGAIDDTKTKLIDGPSADNGTIVIALTNDPSSDEIVYRYRSNPQFQYLNGAEWVAYTDAGANKTNGGDVVELNGVLYTIEPSGTNYYDGWQIVERANNTVVATVKENSGDSYNTATNWSYVTALSAEKVSETKANIYHYHNGVYLTKYTFEVPSVATAIESVAVDANAPVEYYNLQGVKVANPENGLFIKKQGNKATKVIL